MSKKWLRIVMSFQFIAGCLMLAGSLYDFFTHDSLWWTILGLGIIALLQGIGSYVSLRKNDKNVADTRNQPKTSRTDEAYHASTGEDTELPPFDPTRR